MLVLSTGFLISGIGNFLPRWATVIGTNVMLLSSGAMLYSGFFAYCNETAPKTDRFGWLLVVLTVPAFWYWGLIDPNGCYRSMAFSFAVVCINCRTALLLIRFARKHYKCAPAYGMALLFSVLTVWMAIRFVILSLSEPVLAPVKGANPTGWMTVFGYIILTSLLSVCVMWLEVSRIRKRQSGDDYPQKTTFNFMEYCRNKLLLLWSAVTVLIVAIVSMLGISYVNVRASEKSRLIHAAELANKAYTDHATQVINQIETSLNAVRNFYQFSRSLDETRIFIYRLGFDRTVIHNIYLIGVDGKIAISHEPAALGRSIIDRDYFAHHRDSAENMMYISSVASGRVTGKLHFRCSYRINNRDGSFGGIILATVIPEGFSRYYRDLMVGAQGSVAMLGIHDRMLRARVPEPAAERWGQAVESPIWEMLKQSASGSYENNSSVDNIQRMFVYRKIANLPLVMVTGFSSQDLSQAVRERMNWLVFSSLFILSSTLLLAVLLTIEAKRREEQDQFMSMLNHELKTPLSVVRIALGSEQLLREVRAHALRAIVDITSVIERCLQVDRLKHDTASLRYSKISIDELLQELTISCVAPERITLKIEDESLFCTSDQQMMQIVLSNLIDNACKYGAENGEIFIRAAAALRHGKNGIIICITNSIGAAGVPAADKVFKKYYRAVGSHAKTGSGLGLYLCKMLSIRMGAELHYLSGKNDVTFEFWVEQ